MYFSVDILAFLQKFEKSLTELRWKHCHASVIAMFFSQFFLTLMKKDAYQNKKGENVLRVYLLNTGELEARPIGQ